MKIFNFIKNLSIRAKLLAIAGVIGILLLIVGGLTMYFLGKMSEYTKLNIKVQTLTKQIILLRKEEKNFLLKDQYSLEFYQTGNSKSLEAFERNYNNCINLVDELRQDPTMISVGLKLSSNNLKNDLETFHFQFRNFTKLVKDRGYGEFGMVGKMQLSGAEFFNFVYENNNDSRILDIVNLLRLTEKNYLLTRESSYRDELMRHINTLRSELKIGGSNDSTGGFRINRSSIKYYEGLDNYQKISEALIDIDTKIINTLDENSNTEYQKKIANIEKTSEDLLKNISEFNEKSNSRYVIFLIISVLVFLGIIIAILSTIGNSVATIFNILKNQILTLGRGELPEKLTMEAHDERGEIVHALNELTVNLKNTKEFVNEVGKGNLEYEVNVFDNKGDLGSSLVQMRKELLKIAKEREKQELENQKRNWATQGIAKFGDLLRISTDNVEELAYSVIKELVVYLQSDQGALYIINDEQKDNQHLELIALFAYDRRKYLHQKIQIGEGLAGRCAQERETILMTEVPEGYFYISSGLGQATPRSILIVPLNLNNEIFGVIEVASMKVMEQHQVELAEKIAETVASTISNVKISIRTAKLLEETKIQAEELSSKEEEMRQNMEELQATQEEAARKEAQATGFVNAVNHSIIRADFSIDGALMYANTKFLELMGYATSEVQNQDIRMFIHDKDWDNFKKQWDRVVSGGKHIEEEMRLKTKNGNRWFLTTFTPIRDQEGFVVKVLYLAIDIDEQKNKDLDYAGEINTIDRAIIKAEFTPDGKLINANDLFLSTLAYVREDIEGKDVFFFLKKDDVSKFESSWRKIIKGMPYEGKITNMTKVGKERHFRGTYSTVRNYDGDISKIVYIAYDITKQIKDEEDKKLLVDEAKEQLKLIQEREKTLLVEIDDVRKNNDSKEKLYNDLFAYYNSVQKCVSLAFYAVDGSIIKVNPMFCETLGYIESDLVNKNHRSFLDKEYRKSQTYTTFWERLLKGQVQEGDFQMIHKDTAVVHLRGIYYPLLDKDSKVTEILWVGLDVTNSMNVNEEKNQHLHQISKTHAQVEYDLDGTVKSVNELFCDMFGYDEFELLGKNHRIFVTPEEKKSDQYKNFWTELRGNLIKESVFKRLHKDGTVIYLKSVFYPITDSTGKVLKINEISINISDIKDHLV